MCENDQYALGILASLYIVTYPMNPLVGFVLLCKLADFNELKHVRFNLYIFTCAPGFMLENSQYTLGILASLYT